MMATGYEPLDTLKPVADDIWIVDGPPPVGGGCRFPTRATVVRLTDGGLWVQSPTRLTQGLQAELAALGPVAHLVAPNPFHIAHLADWATAYPEATIWAAPGTLARAAKSGAVLPEARDLQGRRAETCWAREMDQIIPRGHRWFQEAVFHHKASGTLIMTDLVQALDTAKLPAKCRPAVWLSGVDDTDGKMPLRLRLGFRDTAALAEDIETMIGWAPRRLILSHGRWYERGAVAELERAFRRVLNARRWDRALGAQKSGGGARR